MPTFTDPEARSPILDDLFTQAGFTPDDHQRAAILHSKGPLFLVAGPGSGKTRVLLWRTLNLIVFEGVSPDRIFLSTFTDKAAKQLRDGLVALLANVTHATGRPFDLSRMYVGTVHALCHRLVADRTLSPERARSDAPAVLDPLDQYFHLAAGGFWRDAQAHLGFEGEPSELRAAINSHFEDHATPSKHKAVTNLISLFNRLSEENLQPAEFLSRVSPGERPLAELYAMYRARLGERRVDLSLLQQAALRALSALPAGHAVFDHVIVDEYQDTNAIQAEIFMRLADPGKNLCVVGDDDQALYRFRGATVSNFVRFPERCRARLGVDAHPIPLDVNYRSRQSIVRFYGRFIGQTDWTRDDGGHHRLNKNISAASLDTGVAVVASQLGPPETVVEEIAGLVRRLIDERRVSDPNQVAFLFPSLKSKSAERFQQALADVGLKVYAPRAKRFLEGDEPSAMIGLLGLVLGRPEAGGDHDRGDYHELLDWLETCHRSARALVKADGRLHKFTRERFLELATIRKDHAALLRTVERAGWRLEAPYDPQVHKRALLNSTGLSDRGRRGLGTAYLDEIARERARRGEPFALRYVVNRATSVDWNVLDLFYRLCGFDHFKSMFDTAEDGTDEGPVCNLALTSQYLARYIDRFPPVITAAALADGRLEASFYHAFLFALFRLGEGEYEDAEDPFPKGRIPFLTVHQSKGLEFPVVVLGSIRPANREVRRVEEMVRPYLGEGGEPLDRMGDFDAMRMFYVALSRARNLLVIPHVRGRGQSIDPAFKALLGHEMPRIADLDVASIPLASVSHSEVARRYSYTGDYLAYLRCPRQYMLFQRYGFAPSRTQTMLFGSLVHQTVEDLHNRLIATRQGGGGA